MHTQRTLRTSAFKQVDVFTANPMHGNALAVIFDAEGLSTDDMQRIAAWTNLSETTFVLPPTQPTADYRLRIFTPRSELPFAGHPSVGTAHALIESERIATKPHLVQECAAGLLPVEVIGTGIEQRIFVRRDRESGFPDDTKAPGPTIVSTATLETVASWIAGLDAGSIRDRLRSNIELGGTAAFWEDRLYAEAGDVVAFRVGEVAFEGTNPCARCIVPSRDAHSGEPTPGFAKRVAEQRAATLPAWANRSRFDHYYRLAGNTRCASGQAGKMLAVGDAVSLGARSSARGG